MIINLFQGEAIGGRIGGGWTFFHNLTEGLKQLGHTISNTGYDVSLACAPTMVPRDQWVAAANKPRVLRLDGVPEDFRNRGTGWSRMREYSQNANSVVYQSNFVKNTIGKLLGRDGTVICNGTNTNVFNNQRQKESFGKPSVLFVYYRNDPNKRFQEVIERFRYYKLDNPEAALTFVGDYPKEQVFWNKKTYDFGMLSLVPNKDWRYIGIITDRNKLATVMKSHDYIAYPSFADPCPNTLIEALSCGCKPLWTNDYGSSNEIVQLFKNGYDFSCKNMAQQYVTTLQQSKKQ